LIWFVQACWTFKATAVRTDAGKDTRRPDGLGYVIGDVADLVAHLRRAAMQQSPFQGRGNEPSEQLRQSCTDRIGVPMHAPTIVEHPNVRDGRLSAGAGQLSRPGALGCKMAKQQDAANVLS
jgi:hypothetical protein